MKNMRIPSRPAPSVDEARQKQRFQPKKKPPPRPPPPNLDRIKSNSAWTLLNITQTSEKEQTQQPRCLIDWSPPISPNASSKRAFAPFVPNSGAGSISSSFSSSTSSLASSKKSFEYDAAFNISPWTNTNNGLRMGPTIIRPTISKKQPRQILSLSRNASPVSSLSSQSTSSSPVPPPSLPPPPSPPKNMDEPEVVPFAIALYEYRTGHPDDLIFEVNDIIYLTERINDEWYRGRVNVQEGMFPATFVDIQVPLPKQRPKPKLATVLYTYTPNMDGYLNLHAGCQITVLHRVDVDWCMGEINGKQGQFPVNHVDKLPDGL